MLTLIFTYLSVLIQERGARALHKAHSPSLLYGTVNGAVNGDVNWANAWSPH